MRTLKELFTAEELERLPSNGKRLELVKGNVYELAPAGGRHGNAAMNIGTFLNVYVRTNNLGRVFAAETGFIVERNPDTVRAPDAAFVSLGRLGSENIPEGFLDFIPDLVVEVVSPSDTGRQVREKVHDWLAAGVRLVWVLYPATGTANVHRATGGFNDLAESDILDGEDVMPGFTCRVGDLFA